VHEFYETILTKHGDKVDPELAKEAQEIFTQSQPENEIVEIPF
jgi:hypothetical protein